MCGYVLQDGSCQDAFPWEVSLPLFFAILPAIFLAGLPDRKSDATAGKLTVCVLLGARRTVLLAGACVVAAVVSAIGADWFHWAQDAYRHIAWLAIPHDGHFGLRRARCPAKRAGGKWQRGVTPRSRRVTRATSVSLAPVTDIFHKTVPFLSGSVGHRTRGSRPDVQIAGPPVFSRKDRYHDRPSLELGASIFPQAAIIPKVSVSAAVGHAAGL